MVPDAKLMNRSGARPPLSLSQQFSWTLPANIIYAGCSWLLLVVLNKMAPTALDGQRVAGEFGWALAICAPAIMFGNLRLSVILATDTSERIRLASYVKLRAVFMVCAIFWVIAAILLNDASQIATLLFIVLLAKVVESASDLCCGVQQKIERMDRIAISYTVNGIVMISTFTAVFALTHDLIYATLGILFSRVLVLFGYDVPMAIKAAKLPVFDVTKADPLAASVYTSRVFCQALPLGITTVFLSLTSNIPRYQIADFYSKETLGVFCSVAAIMQAGSLVFRAIEQPVSPRLAMLIQRGDRRGFWRILNSLLLGFVVLGVVGAAVSLAFGPALLSIVFRPEYATMGGLLALLVLATSVTQMAGMIEASMIAARLIKVQLPMHAVTTLVCFVTGWMLIPRFELVGAVIALAICRFPFMVIGVLLLRQKLKSCQLDFEFSESSSHSEMSTRWTDPNSSDREAA